MLSNLGAVCTPQSKQEILKTVSQQVLQRAVFDSCLWISIQPPTHTVHEIMFI